MNIVPQNYHNLRIRNRTGVCRPLCTIKLRKKYVNQNSADNKSTKMRNSDRVRVASRGWRTVSGQQYKDIKYGKVAFLGPCYKNKK